MIMTILPGETGALGGGCRGGSVLEFTRSGTITPITGGWENHQNRDKTPSSLSILMILGCLENTVQRCFQKTI